MKSNFHLKTSKKHDYHIHLHGVFDGASAFELLNEIQNGGKDEQAISAKATAKIANAKKKQASPSPKK